MNKINSKILKSALVIGALSASPNCQAATYQFKPVKTQDAEKQLADHKVRKNADSWWSKLRELTGLRVSNEDLRDSLKVSMVKGKDVYSNDNIKVGRVHDILWSHSGDFVLIISSNGIIPKLDLGGANRAVFASSAKLEGNQVKLNRDLKSFKELEIVQ